VSAVWLRATAQLRGRVRATVLLAVLVGLAGGVVLAAVAGARRTDAALPRFLDRDRVADAIVDFPDGGQQPGPDPSGSKERALAALPEVAAATRVTEAILASPGPAGPTGRRRNLAILPMDAGGGWFYGRPIIVAGRLPDEREADEAAVDEELAARRHLRIGSVWQVGAYTGAQLEQAGLETPTAPAGPRMGLRIVGIVRHPVDLRPADISQDNLHVNHGDLYLTPAYWHRYGADLARYGILIMVALRQGPADLPRLATDVRRLLGPEAVASPIDPGGLGGLGGEGTLAGLRRATRLESGALLAFALLATVAAVLLVGQTLGRQTFLQSAEYPTLRALGMTGGQLVGVALLQAALIGAGGATVAVATAIALSPLTPIGLARRADLNPGIVADPAVLAVGVFAVVALVAAGAAVPAWRASRAPATALGVAEPVGGRPSLVASALGRAGFPPTAVTGTRLALEPGRGRTAIPVRVAIAGAAAAVLAITAASVFAASLNRLVSTPAAYGWTWDVAVGNFASIPQARRAARTLDAIPGVEGYIGIDSGEVRLDGKRSEIMAVERGKGTVPLAVPEGREPLRPDEIALGTSTLHMLGKHVGDTVAMATTPGQPSQRLHVVGRMVLGAGALDSAIAPGKGAMVDFEVVRRLAPEAAPQTFLVRLDPHSDHGPAVEAFQRAFPGTVVRPLPHPDIDNVHRVAYLPGLLAGLVAFLALGTVTHALVSSVRRRRHDLAVLKSLGFLRQQVSSTLAWQASTFAMAAVLAGVPLGIAGGRWAWRLVADSLGVVSEPVVPSVGVLAITVGALLAVNLMAAGPGWVAGRLRPATVLRSE
jgi:ABC-type lipoprotein release transport system permease subunit